LPECPTRKGKVRHDRRSARRAPPASVLLFLAAVLLLLPSFSALGQGPMEDLQGAVARTVQILTRSDLDTKETQDERRALLQQAIRPLFYFSEMARRALGAHWSERTTREREEFTDLFTRLLEHSYLGKIESFRGGNIRYVKETVKSPFAEVKTLVDTAAGETVSVDYRMLRDGDRWRIYDVLIDGVSILRNCRAQFGTMLRYYSFQSLIERLRSMPACRG